MRVRLDAIAVQRTRRRNLRIVRARVHDDSGRMAALWFNQQHLARILHPGDELLLRGRVSEDGRREMAVRSHEVLGGPASEGVHTQGLVPVYPATEQLPPRRIRELVDLARPLARAAPERLPAWIRERLWIAGAADALVAAHFPRSRREARLGRRRLVLEELIVLQLGLLAVRRREERTRAAPPLRGTGESLRRAPGVPAVRPDRRAAARGPRDRPRPRAPAPHAAPAAGRGRVRQDRRRGPRHLPGGRGGRAGGPAGAHGDARRAAPADPRRAAGPGGAGAAPAHRARPARRARAAADGALHGHGRRWPSARRRSCPRASPSTVWGSPWSTSSTASASSSARRSPSGRPRRPGRGRRPPPLHDRHADPAHPRPDGLRRPHGLDDPGPPPWPGAGRDALGARGRPRPGLRARACSSCVPDIKRTSYARWSRRARRPRRAPRPARPSACGPARSPTSRSASPTAPSAVTRSAPRWRTSPSGRTDLLVATTVVEVGIDVPNATTIVVEGADRFGLAQLHQLRGRVGRGTDQGLCLLFGEPATEEGARRLEALTQTVDGFRLAELDLEIRGEGSILGRAPGRGDRPAGRPPRPATVASSPRRATSRGGPSRATPASSGPSTPSCATPCSRGSTRSRGCWTREQ